MHNEDQTPPEKNPDTSVKDIIKPILLAAALVVIATFIAIGIKQHYFDPAATPAVVTAESTLTAATETTTAATTTAKPVEADTVTVYITEHGTVYHVRRSCQYIRNKSDEELRILTDEEAEDQGYRVCSRCG